MTTYQAHEPDVKAISDTQRKLQRLQIPENLSGKRVLDIGCNEGYFSNLARERGAIDVTGIDFVASNVEFANQRYGGEGIRFLRQTWATLPEGHFDLILWTSAMHYDLDPRSVANSIFNSLSPDGLFILECGVVNAPYKEFVPVPRVADTRWYPTYEFLLHEVLPQFSVRHVAQPEIALGDYVPRSVFHCRRGKPEVILIRGDSGSGKSSLTERLRCSATKVVSLDLFVSRLGLNKHPHDELERFIVANYDPSNLGQIYLGVDSASLTVPYARLLASAVANTDKLVVIEGMVTDAQISAIKQALEGRAIVWDMQRAQELKIGLKD